MDPLASEPIRDNVLLLPQILKEVSSLEQYIAKIQQTLQESEAIVEKDKEDKKAKLALQEETASPSPAKKDKGATNAVKTTSQVYMTQGPLPKRFEEPYTWNYRIKKQHPMYTTTTNQYGHRHPTVHEMPTIFKGQSAKFSEHLNSAGPYRNHSLNTSKCGQINI